MYFELLRRGRTVYAGRTEHGEVDFVVQQPDGTRAYYQVAYTANDEKTLKRELSSLRNIRDSYPKYLLTLDYKSPNIMSVVTKRTITSKNPSTSKVNRMIRLLLFMLFFAYAYNIIFYNEASRMARGMVDLVEKENESLTLTEGQITPTSHRSVSV